MTLRFGTDGVRGVANVELTPELVTALGRAAARVLGTDAPFVVGPRHAAVGPDARGRARRRALRRGRRRRPRSASCRRPASRTWPGSAACAGAMISASHNPYADNGVKLFAAGGRKIPDEIERDVEHELRALAVAEPEPGGAGTGVGVSSEHRGALDDYVAMLVDALEGRQLDGLHVVRRLRQRCGVPRRAPPCCARSAPTSTCINAAPDGVNINAECGSTHPADLQQAVLVARCRRRARLRRRRRPRDRGRRARRAGRRRPDPRDRRARPPGARAAPRRRRRRRP